MKLFSWRILLATALVTAIVSVGLYYLLEYYMLAQAEQSIANVLLEHKGIHHYIQRNTHPALYQLKEQGEVPQNFYSPELLSSSYMLRNIHQYYNEERSKAGQPPIYYKMAATNPRNPINLADEREARLIAMFNRQPQRRHYHEVIEIDGQEYLYYAIPFLANSAACLKCHGDRADAPRQLQERYPGQGGFNEKLGQIRAIEVVRAPLQSHFKAFHLVFAALLAGVAAMALLVMFNRRLGAVVRQATGDLERELAERRQAEDALRASEERFRDLVEGTDDLVVQVGSQGRINYVNHAAQKILGLAPEQCRGRQALDFVHRDDRERTKAAFRGWLRGEPGPYSLYNRQVSLQGVVRHMLWTCNPHYDESGRLVLVNGIASDITERERNERELRASEERNRQIIQTAMDGFIRMDPQGRLVEVNQAYCLMSGYSREELLTMRVTELDTPESAQHTDDRLRRIKEEGELRFTNQHRRKDGTYFDVEVSVQFKPNEGGGEYVCFMRDISEQLRLENQVRHAHKMEAIGTLAGGIAHDFNNLLGAVIGYAETALEDAGAGRDPARDIGEILQAGGRARDLVRQILTFSRKVEVDLRPLDINREVRRAVALLGHSLPKMINIQTSLDPEPGWVMANSSQVEQILLNLGSNAADAMPDGGRLTIETSHVTLARDQGRRLTELAPGRYVLIQVSDTGEGMDEETRRHVFEPFFTTKEVGRGTGLGLATAYGTVKSLGGHISCVSQPGQGATFKLFLPVCDPGEGSPGDDQADEPRAPGGDEAILLVDDDAALRRLGLKTLGRAGYRVEAAASGEEALALYALRGQRFDLIILDLGMPGMGGLKALGALLEMNPRVRVLIASGYAADGQVKSALEGGAAGYVAKPFARMDLLVTVRSLLDGPAPGA